MVNDFLLNCKSCHLKLKTSSFLILGTLQISVVSKVLFDVYNHWLGSMLHVAETRLYPMKFIACPLLFKRIELGPIGIEI